MNIMKNEPFSKMADLYGQVGCEMEHINDITIAYQWLGIEICVFYA